MQIVGLYKPAAVATERPLPKDLEGACQAFEKIFASLVFSKMREAMVPKHSPGSSGFAAQTTEAMLDLQWAELSSQGEGLGLWRAMYRQLQRQQVKSDFSRADQGDSTYRTEAERDPQGGVGTPGQRVGHLRSKVTPAAYAGVPDLSGTNGLRRVVPTLTGTAKDVTIDEDPRQGHPGSSGQGATAFAGATY